MGEEYFYSHSEYEYLYDLPIPLCFQDVFNIFLELYNFSGESITWQSIDAYERVRDISLQQIEIDYIIKMNTWANVIISQLREEET